MFCETGRLNWLTSAQDKVFQSAFKCRANERLCYVFVQNVGKRR